MMKRLIFGFTAAILGAHAWAQGTSPVTVADLRAAYCFPIVKEAFTITSDFYNSGGTSPRPPEVEAIYQKQNFKLNKLGNYLRARVFSLDSAAMAQVTAATNAGENAMAVQKKILAKCGEKFPRSPSDPSSRLQNIIKCGNEEGMKDLRLDQCDELSYLPY